MYAVTSSQRYATAFQFTPLPLNVVAKDRSVIEGL